MHVYVILLIFFHWKNQIFDQYFLEGIEVIDSLNKWLNWGNIFNYLHFLILTKVQLMELFNREGNWINN